MKLEHLAPYLPYKLKGNYEVSEVVPSAKFELRNKELRNDNIDFFLNYAKPILRPLSDLAKEIEHNGENFVPIEKMEKLGWYNMDCINPKKVKCISFGMASFLFEWHFDVFGLIEKNEAIDINTI